MNSINTLFFSKGTTVNLYFLIKTHFSTSLLILNCLSTKKDRDNCKPPSDLQFFFLNLPNIIKIIFFIDFAERNFELIGSTFYFAPNQSLNWFDSQAFCQNLDSELLTIENQKKKMETNYFLSTIGNFFIFILLSFPLLF